jgi:hypothetical protein
MFAFRNQETQQIQESDDSSWSNDIRVVKTSQERYSRSASDSTQSSTDEAVTSISSNIYSPSATHQQAIDSTFNRVFILFFFSNVFINK